MKDGATRYVTFIENDLPGLTAGLYKTNVTQTVNQSDPGSFGSAVQFAVAANRFSLPGNYVQSVFPPSLSVGEFSDVLPHIVLTKRTFPWAREAKEENIEFPWLALLTLSDDEYIKPKKKTASDLIKKGDSITVVGSSLTGTGQLPTGYLSYPNINPLDYGETPDQECQIMDVPLALFNRITPSLNDLRKLAHIRKVDTIDSEDHESDELQFSVVMSNRLSAQGQNTYGVLVSLEHMAQYLPADDGTPSSNIPSDTKFVRLTVLKEWRFFNNGQDKVLVNLLKGLNKTPDLGVSSLRLPPASVSAPDPSESAVKTALSHQAAGQLTDTDADVLVQNAYAMGYCPMTHHLRDAGVTASWYRGPLAPFYVELPVNIPAATSDSMLRFDPQSGLFDVSYASAWQLGQLMGLQSKTFANALYQWKRSLIRSKVVQAEMQLLTQSLANDGFNGLMSAANESALMNGVENIPPEVSRFVTNIRLLKGVPFAYLVPDERMLPVESLRWFQLDSAWIKSLVDGAFSIGRGTLNQMERDQQLASHCHQQAWSQVLQSRQNPKPLALRDVKSNGQGPITGILIRSQAVAGWPRLQVKGFADAQQKQELLKLRMVRLSANVLLCLFDGQVNTVLVQEPSEALHCGVEAHDNGLVTTLREVIGDMPGQQYPLEPNGTSTIKNRSLDAQTLAVQLSAETIKGDLNTHFAQNLQQLTSAEMALELIKGAVRVTYTMAGK